MADPETTTLVGVASMYGLPLFTETVKFLYGLATEALKARREHKKAAGSSLTVEPQVAAMTPLEPPDIVEGRLDPLIIDFHVLEPLADLLNDLSNGVITYAQGTDDIDLTDREMLTKLDELRNLLEVVYSQRITFKGEQREASGPLVKGSIDVNEVAGYAAAVRAKLVTSGTVIGHSKVEKVFAGGQLVGTEVDTIRPEK